MTRTQIVAVRQVRSHRGLAHADRMGVRRIAGRNMAKRDFVRTRGRIIVRRTTVAGALSRAAWISPSPASGDSHPSQAEREQEKRTLSET